MKHIAQIFAAFALSILIVQCGKDVPLKQASNMPTMGFVFDVPLAKRADSGDARAQCLLGLCYQNGEGVPKNMIEAVKWFRKAAEQNEKEAQFYLGFAHDSGNGASRDIAEAMKWYRMSADQGFMMAQAFLGMCYDFGKGGTKNPMEAVYWYRKAAEQGDSNAQTSMGLCYAYGAGVPQDYAEAVKWYKKAADQNHCMAQFNLGICYLEGNGVSKDLNQAMHWLLKAAERNDPNAQSFVGAMYFRGGAIKKDLVQAYKWINLAAAQEQHDASQLRNIVGTEMSPQNSLVLIRSNINFDTTNFSIFPSKLHSTPTIGGEAALTSLRLFKRSSIIASVATKLIESPRHAMRMALRVMSQRGQCGLVQLVASINRQSSLTRLLRRLKLY